MTGKPAWRFLRPALLVGLPLVAVTATVVLSAHSPSPPVSTPAAPTSPAPPPRPSEPTIRLAPPPALSPPATAAVPSAPINSIIITADNRPICIARTS